MEITYHTLIKKELWDAARWRGTGFLHAPDDSQPGIALIFEDVEAAKILFADLRHQLGEGDPNEHLRVSIIVGTHKDGQTGYSLRFGPNPATFIGDGPECYTFTNSRSRFMETGGKNTLLDLFRKDYETHGKYFIVPLDGNNPQVDLSHMIGKVGIFFRDFRDLTPDDFDGDIEGA